MKICIRKNLIYCFIKFFPIKNIEIFGDYEIYNLYENQCDVCNFRYVRYIGIDTD